MGELIKEEKNNDGIFIIITTTLTYKEKTLHKNKLKNNILQRADRKKKYLHFITATMTAHFSQ